MPWWLKKFEHLLLKIVPDAGYGMFSWKNWPIGMKQRRNSTSDREESYDRDFDAASGTKYRISRVSVFKESCRKDII